MRRATIKIDPPPNEKGLYRVVYVIDIAASGCVDAARHAHRIMSSRDSIAPLLQVIDRKGKVTRIDLSKR